MCTQERGEGEWGEGYIIPLLDTPLLLMEEEKERSPLLDVSFTSSYTFLFFSMFVTQRGLPNAKKINVAK